MNRMPLHRTSSKGSRGGLALWRRVRSLTKLDVALAGAVTLLFLYIYFIYLVVTEQISLVVEHKYSTCIPSQPLYTVRHYMFDPEDFHVMKERLVDSKLARAKNALDKKNFGATSGIVITFNLEGIQQLRNTPQLSDFATFFDAVRLNGSNGGPNANAFVMNLLLTQPDDPRREPREAAAGEHRDNTLQLKEWPWEQTSIFSYVTTVLYLSVPSDMEGGNMVLRPTYRQPGINVNEWPKALQIQPQENMVLEFRGDTLHKVESYRTSLGEKRCSLVLEQYVLPPELYEKTHVWKTSRRIT